MKYEIVSVRRHDLEDAWEVHWGRHHPGVGFYGQAKVFNSEKEADAFAAALRAGTSDTDDFMAELPAVPPVIAGGRE